MKMPDFDVPGYNVVGGMYPLEHYMCFNTICKLV